MMAGHPTSGASAQVDRATVNFGAATCGLIAAISPFDLALPANGWTDLFLRPLLLLTGFVSAAVIFTRRARLQKPLAGACGLIVATLALSSAVSDNPTIGYSVTIRLAILCLLFLAASASFETMADLRALTIGLTVGVASASIIGLVVLSAGKDVLGTNHLVGAISETNGVQRFTRPFSHTGVAAMFLAPAVGYLSVQSSSTTMPRSTGQTVAGWRILAATTVLGGLALSLTLSRGGNLSLAIVLTAFLMVTVLRPRLINRNRSLDEGPRYRAMPALPMIVLLTIVACRFLWPPWSSRLDPIGTGTAPQPMSRPEIWRQAIDVFGDNMLAGVGPGQFGPASVARTADGFAAAPHAHNLPLEMLATGGVVVAGAVTVAVAVTLVPLAGARRGRTPRSFPAGAIVALAVIALHMIVDYPLPFSSSGNLVCLVAGAGVGLARGAVIVGSADRLQSAQLTPNGRR